jgi:putative addiction module component (TIGR02574 family)
MSETSEKIFSEALSLSPNERADLVDKLLSSFEFPPDQSIDELWAKEAEDRIDAYERGEISAKPAKEVFDKLLGKSSR